MKKSKQLEPIENFNKQREETAIKQLALTTQELAQQKQRLFDLESYRADYGKQFAAICEVGLNASKLREYQRFLENLSNVVEHQKSSVRLLDQQLDEKKRQWLAARSRTKALETVKDRYERQETLIDEKKLQKEIDDRGSRIVKD